MNKLILIITFCIALTSSTSCQEKKDPILLVLSQHKIGTTFTFDSSQSVNAKNIIRITYLGKVETKAHIEYSILTWARIWGANEHTTGVIFLYGGNNQYVGKYVLGGMSDLPDKVESNNLIFTNKNKESCDKSLVTKISFDSIPKNIFIKCEGNDGDVYSYTNDN